MLETIFCRQITFGLVGWGLGGKLFESNRIANRNTKKLQGYQASNFWTHLKRTVNPKPKIYTLFHLKIVHLKILH